MANSTVVQDNLAIIPTFAAVPEMNGAWAVGLLAVFLGTHFIRRRVVRSNA
jgi:hypothetical protein